MTVEIYYHPEAYRTSSPKRAAKIVAGIPSDLQAFVFRALVWLVKLGIL